MKYWQTSRRKLSLDRPLVMGILNVTPDSFSDGGSFTSLETAVKQAEKLVNDGADILDIGGESTRPQSQQVSVEAEIRRVIPVIAAIAASFDTPISIDTTKSTVAQRAVDAGAEIINDISGLRFDEHIAEVAATSNSGLVLMHSRGTFETMHAQPPVDDILNEVTASLKRSLGIAKDYGVLEQNIALDIGLGFGKTFEQNLELLAKLDKIVNEFRPYPLLVGASRKSFIGKVLGDIPPSERLGGSIAAAVFAVARGANIIRVHDVFETVCAMKLVSAVASDEPDRYP